MICCAAERHARSSSRSNSYHGDNDSRASSPQPASSEVTVSSYVDYTSVYIDRADHEASEGGPLRVSLSPPFAADSDDVKVDDDDDDDAKLRRSDENTKPLKPRRMGNFARRGRGGGGGRRGRGGGGRTSKAMSERAIRRGLRQRNKQTIGADVSNRYEIRSLIHVLLSRMCCFDLLQNAIFLLFFV